MVVRRFFLAKIREIKSKLEETCRNLREFNLISKGQYFLCFFARIQAGFFAFPEPRGRRHCLGSPAQLKCIKNNEATENHQPERLFNYILIKLLTIQLKKFPPL